MIKRSHTKEYIIMGCALAGGIGLAVGLVQLHHNNLQMSRLRRKAAKITGYAARYTGDAISRMGQDIANRIR